MGTSASTPRDQSSAIGQQQQSPNKLSADQKQLDAKSSASPNKRKKIQIDYLMGILQKIPNDYSEKNSKDIKLTSQKQQFQEQVQIQLRNIYQNLIEDTIKLVNQNDLTIKQCKVKICQAIIHIHIEVTKSIQKYAKIEDARAFCKEIKQFLKKVCTYLKSKYPRSQTIKSWQMFKYIKQFDCTQEYQYDMLRQAEIYFGQQEQYEITKNIKIFLNKVLDQYDGYQQNYRKFRDIIENQIFDVKEPNATPQFKIGRKLNEDTSRYSRFDTGIVQVTTSEISRVLVKWMQDLSQMLEKPENKITATNEYKFYDPSKTQPFSICSSSTLNQLIKSEFIQKTVKQQNKKFQDKKGKLQEVFDDFNLDIASLFSQTKFSQHQLARDQMQVIKYADYNNQFISWMSQQNLIQSIKSLIRIGRQNNQPDRNLNFIKFKINDLMRCQIFGDGKVIKKVYDNFFQLQKNSILKILKVKNRLNSSMNDAMIFFKIKDCFLVCQCQLVLTVQSHGEDDKKAKNIQELNHFLYQLERSPFGVVAEAAVFLKTKSQSMSYCKQIQLSMQDNSNVKKCLQNHLSNHEIKTQSNKKPFICSKCLRCYPKFSNLVSIQKCIVCRFSFCNNCMKHNQQIQKMQGNSIGLIKAQFRKKVQNYLQLRNRSAQQILKTQKLTQENWTYNFFKVFKKNFEYLKDKFGKEKQNNIKTQSIIHYLKKQYTKKWSQGKDLNNIYFTIVTWKRECPLFKCFLCDFRLQKIYNCHQPLESYEKHELMSVSDYDILLLFSDLLQSSKLQSLNKIKAENKLNESFALFQDQNLQKMKAQLQEQTQQKFKNSNFVYKQFTLSPKDPPQDYWRLFNLFPSQCFINIVVNHQDSAENHVNGRLKDYIQKNYTTTMARKNTNLNLNYLGLNSNALVCFLDKQWQSPRNIKILSLSANYIEDLSPILQACKNLQQIDAKQNKLSKIKFFNHNASLIIINFAHNAINQICGLRALTNLEQINFKYNNLGKQFQKKGMCQNIRNQNIKKIEQNIQNQNIQQLSQKNMKYSVKLIRKNKKNEQSIFQKNICNKLSKMFCFSIDKKEIIKTKEQERQKHDTFSTWIDKKEYLGTLPQKIQKTGKTNKIDQNSQNQQPISDNSERSFPSKNALQKKQLGSQEQQQCNKFSTSLFQHNNTLRKINLSYNQNLGVIKILPHNLLTTLVLQSCGLKSLQFLQSQDKYPLLTYLNVGINQIQYLPKLKQSLPRLRVIVIERNKLREIKQFSQGFYNNLEQLDLSHNNLGGHLISQMHQLSLGSCPNLEILNLSNNNLGGQLISQMQQLSLGNYPNLKSLDLSYNKLGGQLISQMQQLSLGNYPNLERLNLSNNTLGGQLSKMQQFSLGNYPNLKRLDLSDNNELEVMPKFKAANQLQTLILNNNKLTSLPDIQNLPKINYLCLNGKFQIRNIDMLDVPSRYKQLKVLNMTLNVDKTKFQDLIKRIQKEFSSTKVELMNGNLMNYTMWTNNENSYFRFLV